MNKVTQKDLDLEVADRLDTLASKLSLLYPKEGTEKVILYCESTDTEYLNFISALRYAVSSLRTENKE